VGSLTAGTCSIDRI